MSTETHWEAWQRVTGRDDVDVLEVLGAAAMYERYFEEVQSHAARVARAQGRSWQEIADAVGTTKQTVWKKWRPPAERVHEDPVRFAKFGAAGRTTELAVHSYERLVDQVVDSWCGPDDPIRTKLVRAAQEALEDAFDSHAAAGSGVPFDVYATWWMRQAVTRRRNELRAN